MNELTPKLPPKLQRTLEQYFSSPTPRPEFASRLETQLRQNVEGKRAKQSITERTPFLNGLRTRPLVAIFIVLIILLMLSGVAYALGRVFGYIPGIGLVEQAASLRTIKAPVSIEREGIQLTVLNVAANPTSTSIRFQVEWLTPPPTAGDFDTSCQGTPSFTLPNGTTLKFEQTTDKFSVGEPGSNTGYGYVMEFGPVPVDQNEVTFLYPCLIPLAPGPLPRDWQIPIHLIPAPEGMALPVVTVPATEAITTPAIETATPLNPTLPQLDSTHRISISLDSFVPMDDGYLLIGSMRWSANDYPAYGVKPVQYMGYVNVVDSNGQDVPWEEVYGNEEPRNEEYRSYWAIKVLNKTFAPPLKITLTAADVKIQPIDFQFDVGSAPQAGQSWDVNQDIQVAGSFAHIVKANLISYEGNLNFQLEVQVDANTIGDLYINTPLNQCPGGGGAYPTEHTSTLQIYVPMCRPDLPPGRVEMQVTGAVFWGVWQVTWQP